MNILFISLTFPDDRSPAKGTYNAALCRELSHEHQVHVISPRLFTEAVPNRLRGRRTCLPSALSDAGLSAEYPTFWYTPKFRQDCSGDQMWWSVRKTVLRAIRDFRPDAVLSYWAHPEGEVGVRAARIAGVPAAVIVGGTDVLILPNLPRRGARVRDVLVQSDAVITVSEGLRDAVIKLNVAGDRVRTIYQGIDAERFNTDKTREQCRRDLGLDADVRHLLWVGRMVPIKALPVLLDAASVLREQGLRFRLHLLGDGPDRPRLERQSEALRLSDFVQFHGAVGHDTLADWYRAADLTVLSSISEGLPNVLRESLACGTPFVTTAVGSVREIADPSYSVMVPVNDSAALALGLQTALAPEYRENAARYRARTWQECAAETATLLSELSAGPGRGRSGIPRSPANLESIPN